MSMAKRLLAEKYEKKGSSKKKEQPKNDEKKKDNPKPFFSPGGAAGAPAHKTKIGGGGGSGSGGGSSDEKKKNDNARNKERLLKARADKEEILVAKESLKVVPIAAIEAEFKSIATTIRTKLASIPRSLSERLSVMTSPAEIETLLRNSINSALCELSEPLKTVEESRKLDRERAELVEEKEPQIDEEDEGDDDEEEDE